MSGRHAKGGGAPRWPVIAGLAVLLGVAVAATAFALIRSEPVPTESRGTKAKTHLSDISSAVDSQTTSSPTTLTPPAVESRPAPKPKLKRVAPSPRPKPLATVALQPSHQDDTGEGWHEYIICADIARRTFAAEPRIKWVMAQDTKHGLTGTNNYRPQPTNTPAFDKEVAIANAAGAQYFISIHNDGGAPSGVLGEYMPGDNKGARLTEYLVNRLSARLGLPNRGLREVRLYSLEPERNHARYRSLLEIGDNVGDRRFLSSTANRRKIGKVLGAAIAAFATGNGAR